MGKSKISNYILTAPFMTEETRPFLSDLNEKLIEVTAYQGLAFKSVERHAGGHMAMEADVYLAAMNHVMIDTVVNAINFVLDDPEGDYDKRRFQLFVQEQEESRFKEIPL